MIKIQSLTHSVGRLPRPVRVRPATETPAIDLTTSIQYSFHQPCHPGPPTARSGKQHISPSLVWTEISRPVEQWNLTSVRRSLFGYSEKIRQRIDYEKLEKIHVIPAIMSHYNFLEREITCRGTGSYFLHEIFMIFIRHKMRLKSINPSSTVKKVCNKFSLLWRIFSDASIKRQIAWPKVVPIIFGMSVVS
jgi:hypothetical protein